MGNLEQQLAASVAYVRERKRQQHDDIDEWLDAVPPPPKRPKRLKGKKMTQAIVTTQDGHALVVHQEPSLEFTPQQKAMIRDTYANGATEKEFQVLLEVAKLRRLNPLLRQIHFVKRWNRDLGRDVWAAQVSVDGLRAIAERTGKYDGQDEPEYECDDKGKLVSCRVKVYRKDWSRPAVGVAYWSEYVQTKKDGSPTRFWADMPRVMLAKCAEAIAMRKAFPEDMGGLYTDEEMQQTENERPQLANIGPNHGPGEDPAAPDQVSDEFNDIMGTLGSADRYAFNPACTWDEMTRWRSIIGSKAAPSELGKRLSALWHGDTISPGQKKEMGALWNRIDRKLTQLEGKLKPPPIEASFTDELEDGTEALGAPEREPGEDDD